MPCLDGNRAFALATLCWAQWPRECKWHLSPHVGPRPAAHLVVAQTPCQRSQSALFSLHPSL